MKGIIKNYLSYAVDNEALKIANKIIKSSEWIKATREVQAPVFVPKPNNVLPQVQKIEEPPKIENQKPIQVKKVEMFDNDEEEFNFPEEKPASKADESHKVELNDEDEEEFDLK